jgi:hypothetical protein
MTEPLSPKELAALNALLTAHTIAAAALDAGVDERTVRRYLERPEFRKALREAQVASVMASTSALSEACSDAVAALKSVIADPEAPHAAQVAAARAILMLAHQAVTDADMADRLERLEQAAGEK